MTGAPKNKDESIPCGSWAQWPRSERVLYMLIEERCCWSLIAMRQEGSFSTASVSQQNMSVQSARIQAS